VKIKLFRFYGKDKPYNHHVLRADNENQKKILEALVKRWREQLKKQGGHRAYTNELHLPTDGHHQ
jgi:hypothetical protein